MFTPLAKLAIGLSATMATAFYYLAAAPPASAQDLCGAGNFSSACTTSPQSTRTQPPRVIRNPVPVVPVVESPSPVIADPVQEPIVESPSPVIADPVQEPVVESPSPVIADPVQEPVVESPSPVIADPIPQPVTEPPLTAPPGDLGNIYPSPTSVTPTAIPEPGTVVALLVTGAGIICCGRKRNKQVRQQR
jgi:hypothetical protein